MSGLRDCLRGNKLERIVEMQGGKIWVESQVGQGSTFAFTVPVRAAQQVQSA